MKKFIPLLLVILLFYWFNSQIGLYSGLAEYTIKDYENGLKYRNQEPPIIGIDNINDWIKVNSYKQAEPYLLIELLIKTAYGYIFFGLFAAAGAFIKPRKWWIPISIGIYLGLAYLFTFI